MNWTTWSARCCCLCKQGAGPELWGEREEGKCPLQWQEAAPLTHLQHGWETLDSPLMKAGWATTACPEAAEMHASHSTSSFTSLQSPVEKKGETAGRAMSSTLPLHFLAYSVSQHCRGAQSLLKSSTSTERSQAADMHCDLLFLCNLIRGIWRKSSEERKKDHSWLFAIFLTLFARGRGYGCVVYPPHGAKRQHGAASSTPSSGRARQGEALRWDVPRTGTNGCKNPQVRSKATASIFTGQSFSCFLWGKK